MYLKYFLVIVTSIICISSCYQETESFNPEKPKGLDKEAQWIGGPDGGGWFLITECKKCSANQYKIQNFFEDGIKQWDDIFIVKKTGFNIKSNYEFIMMSDYSRCTIKQNEVIYVFERSR